MGRLLNRLLSCDPTGSGTDYYHVTLQEVVLIIIMWPFRKWHWLLSCDPSGSGTDYYHVLTLQEVVLITIMWPYRKWYWLLSCDPWGSGTVSFIVLGFHYQYHYWNYELLVSWRWQTVLGVYITKWLASSLELLIHNSFFTLPVLLKSAAYALIMHSWVL